MPFQIPGDEKPRNGFQYVNCHIVFDIKMEDFHRKACLVAGGQMTNIPHTITFSSVVTRETLCIALTMAALHDLEVKAADVLNAYVMAANNDKTLTVLCPEFGDNAGKSATIVRALYGLKCTGASFRAHLAECMGKLGYQSCDADPNLWMKAEYRPEDKLELYFTSYFM